MTAWVVADSGIFIATALVETYSWQAEVLLRTWREQGVQVAAPTLFRYEIVAVMRKSVYRGHVSMAQGLNGRDALLEYPVQLLMDDTLLKRGYELATQYNRPTAYDAQYVAVAERLGCEFWTADERLFNTLKGSLSWVKWLGHYQSEPEENTAL
jgi:predicted nucleic acid-binding protein